MKLRIPWSSGAPAGRRAAGRVSSVRPPGKGARQDAPLRPAPARGGQAGGRPGRILAAKLRRAQGRVFPWRNTAIYGALVAVVGLGIAAWDRAYESQFRSQFGSPSPNVLARNLVENIIGPGTVHSVSVDPKIHAADMTIEDVLIKPGQSKADQRQNLTREGALAISVLQSQLKDLKKITMHIVKGQKPLATVTAGGNAAPTVDFAPDLR